MRYPETGLISGFATTGSAGRVFLIVKTDTTRGGIGPPRLNALENEAMKTLMFDRQWKNWRTGERETHRTKADAGEVKTLLGLDPKAHFPPEGMPEREVQGVRLYVTPERGDKRRKHRVFAICECGTHVPAGRMFQHKCKGA